MPCENYGSVIVCGPPRGVYRRTERDCPECDERHEFVQRWDGVWYGTTLFGACGDTWQDGYRSPRPFRRYWRRDAKATFQRMWDHAAPQALYDAYVDADERFAMADGTAWEQACADRDAALAAIHAHSAPKDA